MKQPFNNIGVAQVQAQIIALPPGERAVELQQMRSDFIAWMDAHFELSSSEQEQLSSLPLVFREEIAHQVANVFEEGGTFSFFKQDHATGRGEPRDKDILLQPVRRLQYSFEEEELKSTTDLTIRIT